MKKSITLFALLILCSVLHGQITTKNMGVSPKTTSLRTIPPQKAVLVRKDVLKLKVQMVQLSDSITVTKSEIDKLIDSMKNDLDSMSEMGETESLRLQQAMDRLSKMMSTLSNIMKKISDTSQGITQNLK